MEEIKAMVAVGLGVDGDYSFLGTPVHIDNSASVEVLCRQHAFFEQNPILSVFKRVIGSVFLMNHGTFFHELAHLKVNELLLGRRGSIYLFPSALQGAAVLGRSNTWRGSATDVAGPMMTVAYRVLLIFIVNKSAKRLPSFVVKSLQQVNMAFIALCLGVNLSDSLRPDRTADFSHIAKRNRFHAVAGLSMLLAGSAIGYKLSKKHLFPLR